MNPRWIVGGVPMVGLVLLGGIIVQAVDGPGDPNNPAPNGEPTEVAPFEQVLEKDAEQYARDFNVSLDEAKQRLLWQIQSAPLKDALRKVAPDRVARIWTQHEPTWAVVVAFTGGSEGLEEAYRIADASDIPVEIRTGASNSADDLADIQMSATAQLDEAGLAGSYTDATGAVVIEVLRDSIYGSDPAALESELERLYGVDFRIDVVDGRPVLQASSVSS